MCDTHLKGMGWNVCGSSPWSPWQVTNGYENPTQMYHFKLLTTIYLAIWDTQVKDMRLLATHQVFTWSPRQVICDIKFRHSSSTIAHSDILALSLLKLAHLASLFFCRCNLLAVCAGWKINNTANKTMPIMVLNMTLDDGEDGEHSDGSLWICLQNILHQLPFPLEWKHLLGV